MIFIASQLLFYFFIIPPFSYGADTLAANQYLSGNQTLVSPGGKFALGFFALGGSSNCYIGIWYNMTTTTQTVVWVAKRDTPISNPFSSKLLIIDGNLVLLDESNKKFWSTNMNSTTITHVLLILNDDGNLVLRYNGSNSRPPIWQSFDHPTHTILLGGKLGYNKRTSTAMIPTGGDPGGGVFSVEIDQNNKRYLIKWNTFVDYWGPRSWNEQIPELGLNYIFNFSYLHNENECYFTYSLYNPPITASFDRPIPGQFKQLSWLGTTQDWYLFLSQPRNFCEVYGDCGMFGVCNGEMVCNCLAYFEPRSQRDWNMGAYSGGCVRKHLHKKHNPVTMAILTTSIAGMVLVLLLFVVIIYTRKKTLITGKITIEGLLVAFVFKDLQRATKNFSEIIGKGGFGSVFKGVLHDSTIVAVKKLESVNQGDKQFRSEVNRIGIIQHVNVVRLRGFCAQGHNKLLVYDYMPNGSPHSHLFHGKQDEVLNWETRYRIALGTAKGLVYLHEKCRDCIIHGDIKPENILLDADFSPKIADFGLAKLLGQDFSRVLTTVRGTRGYLAPEWLDGVVVTTKADVYSYGMMLFELVSGKRNVEQSLDSSFTFFPSLAANIIMPGGDILSLLDSRLNMDASVEQVTNIFKVAYWCIQDEEDKRPSTSQVEQILDGNLDVEMPSIPQSIQFLDVSEDLVFMELSGSRIS